MHLLKAGGQSFGGVIRVRSPAQEEVLRQFHKEKQAKVEAQEQQDDEDAA
jgi:hypothetical protein